MSCLKVSSVMTFAFQDSVVFLEDGLSSPVPAIQESGNKQKKLRSLNDVLGKNIPPIKAIKNSPGNPFLQCKGHSLAFSLAKSQLGLISVGFVICSF